MTSDTDSAVRQIEFELEKAERGMALPYDAERVGQLRPHAAHGPPAKAVGGVGEAEDYLTGTRADANAPVA